MKPLTAVLLLLTLALPAAAAPPVAVSCDEGVITVTNIGVDPVDVTVYVGGGERSGTVAPGDSMETWGNFYPAMTWAVTADGVLVAEGGYDDCAPPPTTTTSTTTTAVSVPVDTTTPPDSPATTPPTDTTAVPAPTLVTTAGDAVTDAEPPATTRRDDTATRGTLPATGHNTGLAAVAVAGLAAGTLLIATTRKGNR